MKRNLPALANEPFDVLVIGGGIFGAGVARDAALRGLRVALIEQADFASGTSSRSSKLIHGGLRYLEHAAFRLVAESCRERFRLRQLAPHLVKLQPFIFPFQAGDPRPLWKIRAGLQLYDALAGRHSLGRHRRLTNGELTELEPTLQPADRRGAVLYYDCREDDARFCVETIRHAADCGAVCANYCELTGLRQQGDRTIAAQVRDRLTGDEFEIRAQFFVNATGPWLERWAGPGLLSPTKGVHLVVPALTRSHAITFQARRDGRILFVIPWGDCSLVGTTDTDWIGNPADARATSGDVEYLLTEVRRLFPAAENPITTFAGVRPLLRSTAAASARHREHRILRQGANLFSMAGGKFTTFRLVAQQVVDQLTTAPCRTADTPWPMRNTPNVAEACAEEMALTVSDYMRRRTDLALSRGGGMATAERVAREMAGQLGWTDEHRQSSLTDYLAERNS